MTIILLEGPDLSGKSTLARDLVERFPAYQLLKQGPPTDSDIIKTYLRPLEEHAPHHSLVLDRWHVGELIYGPLLRGRSLLTDRQAMYIEMVLQTYGCAFWHITSPIPTLEDRYDMRADNLIKREWLGQLQWSYFQYIAGKEHWRTFVPSHPEDTIPYYGAITYTSPLAGRYIGPRKPKVLLLGDERASDEFIFPFVPRRATSGHWLMGALMSVTDLNPLDVGIMNACEIDTTILVAQWESLGKPPVITLGRNAERAWPGAEVGPHKYLHHPQYMRRFHHQHFADYGSEIKDSMR